MNRKWNAELDPDTQERIYKEHGRRKNVTYVLLILFTCGLFLGLFSLRYGEIFSGLSRSTEMATFLSIAGAILVLTVLYWRCPNCGHLFLWQLQPKSCDKCGVNLVKIKEETVDPNDWRYYIRRRRANVWKFFLFAFLIVVFNAVFLYLLTSQVQDIPTAVIVIWVLVLFMTPLFVIERVFMKCPKCGHYFGRNIPEECPQCKAQLKDYNWSDFRYTKKR